MEFKGLLGYVRGARSVLEIGSRYGQSLLHFAQACATGSRVVSVDLGYSTDRPDVNTRENWDEAIEALKPDYDVHQIVGDSHAAETIERVKALGPYDFIFIDGDHSLKGCLQDWTHYGGMGKVVAFHDVAAIEDVAQVWNIAKVDKKHCLLYETGGFGIGVVFNG